LICRLLEAQKSHAVADSEQLAPELIMQNCVCRSSTLAALARGSMKAEHDDLVETLDGMFDDHHGMRPARAAKARYLLPWFIRLPDSSGTFDAIV
jgi:hypothetical protein